MSEQLESWGIETIRCDLLDPEAVAALPKVRNIVYMAGKKFGTNDDPSFAWAMNTYVPAIVAREFAHRGMVVFSTLCVYPFGAGGAAWLGRVASSPAARRLCQLLRRPRARLRVRLAP